MKKFMILLVLFITIGCTNKEIAVTNDSIIGKWQFNGSTDLQKYYKKHGNGMYASTDITGEIMKVGHLFLDGSYIEFKQNNIASFESEDVKYEIHKVEGNFQIKFIDNKGVVSTHLITLTPNTLQIDYFTLDKIADEEEINKPSKIDMSAKS